MDKSSFLAELQAFGIQGQIRHTAVVLQPYHAGWVNAFLCAKTYLQQALKDPSYLIEHTGSTSIPGTDAKPILDISVTCTDLAQLLQDIPALEALGFEYKGDGISRVNPEDKDPTRHSFSFYDDAKTIDFIHIHAMPVGNPSLERILKFRDALRKRPDLVAEYNALKRELCRSGDRRAYTLKKDPFVEKVLRTTG